MIKCWTWCARSKKHAWEGASDASGSTIPSPFACLPFSTQVPLWLIDVSNYCATATTFGQTNTAGRSSRFTSASVQLQPLGGASPQRSAAATASSTASCGGGSGPAFLHGSAEAHGARYRTPGGTGVARLPNGSGHPRCVKWSPSTPGCRLLTWTTRENASQA